MPEFTTEPAEPPADRVERFQAAASTAFAPLRVRAHEGPPFHAAIRAESAGALLVSDIRTSPVTVSRHARQISSTDNDVYKVALQLSGTMGVAQDGRHEVMRPGDLAVYDITRPYSLEHFDAPADGVRTVVITCPRRTFPGGPDALRRIVATPIPADRGVTRLVAGFFTGLADELPDLGSGPHLADAVVDLIGLAFTGPQPVDDRSALVERMIAYCEANLGDPTLSPRTVARAHHLSVRYVHHLFAQTDRSLAAWIRSRRLDHIRRDLENPLLAHRTVSSIAARWGLYDAPHVSRLFRAAYGVSPSTYRRSAGIIGRSGIAGGS
ncbi:MULTISPECIES: helix-turn-helix domain-containing protein [unclassified Saccharothrix]|uniref:AraC-like ligand-binding domain-containing protein n=1 Tax=unclassified Saccharothrix TaxID=2593673 RepID=UPI00307E30C7